MLGIVQLLLTKHVSFSDAWASADETQYERVVADMDSTLKQIRKSNSSKIWRQKVLDKKASQIQPKDENPYAREYVSDEEEFVFSM